MMAAMMHGEYINPVDVAEIPLSRQETPKPLATWFKPDIGHGYDFMPQFNWPPPGEPYNFRHGEKQYAGH